MPPPRMSPMMNSSSILRVSVGLSELSRSLRAGSDSAWAAMASPYPRRAHVKPEAFCADVVGDMSRALSLLAAFASPVFMVAAIAGWLYGVWPANPLTLGVSALLVVGGPILGIVHVATASEDEEEPLVLPARVIVARGVPLRPEPARWGLTPRPAAARRFAAWRDAPNPAITLR